MRIINVYQLGPNRAPALLTQIKENSDKNKWNVSDAIRKMKVQQRTKDILNLGSTKTIQDFGFKELYFDRGIYRTWDADSDQQILYPVVFEDATESVDEPIYLGFELYPQGYVIQCIPPGISSDMPGLFWICYTTQPEIEKPIRLTRQWNSAKIWTTLPYMYEWCDIHEKSLSKMKKNGWQLSMEYHNTLSEHDRNFLYNKFRAAKRKELDRLEESIKSILQTAV